MVIGAETGARKPVGVVGNDGGGNDAEPADDDAPELLARRPPDDGRRDGEEPNEDGQPDVEHDLCKHEERYLAAYLPAPDATRGGFHYVVSL